MRAAPPAHRDSGAYEGWSHFRQNRAAIEAEFDKAPADIREIIRWAPIGDRLVVDV